MTLFISMILGLIAVGNLWLADQCLGLDLPAHAYIIVFLLYQAFLHVRKLPLRHRQKRPARAASDSSRPPANGRTAIP